MNYIRETVEYLKNYNNLDKARLNLKDEIIELHQDLKSVKGITYSDMPHGSGEGSLDDELINKMFRLSVAKELYKSTLTTLKRMDKTLERFNETNPLFSKILKLYFIDCWKEEEIMKEMNYSDRHLRRMKQQALRCFAIQLFGIKVLGA